VLAGTECHAAQQALSATPGRLPACPHTAVQSGCRLPVQRAFEGFQTAWHTVVIGSAKFACVYISLMSHVQHFLSACRLTLDALHVNSLPLLQTHVDLYGAAPSVWQPESFICASVSCLQSVRPPCRGKVWCQESLPGASSATLQPEPARLSIGHWQWPL